MRVLFMGTDAFAVPSLEAIAGKHEVVAVITQPEKPRGRGLKVSPTPVKTAAEKLGIPVLEPKSLKKESFRNSVGELNYDIVVLVAYGRLLPEEFIEKPEKGCLCVHPSMLPEYRGCSPIESAILEGKEKTGISVFFIEKDIDTGAVVYQEEFPISPDDTGGTLRGRLAEESPHVLLKALGDLEQDTAYPVPQPDGCFSYAPKYCRDDAGIDWDKTAYTINNLIRAFNPKPGAFTHYKGKVLKILKAVVLLNECTTVPGTVVSLEKGRGFTVACGKGQLLLLEVQPEGKNPMDAWAFVLGYHPAVGDRLGEQTAQIKSTSEPAEEAPTVGANPPIIIF